VLNLSTIAFEKQQVKNYRSIKIFNMEHKKRLEELNKESLEKLEEYLKTKETLLQVDREKVHKSKEEWQVAWGKLMEALMVLERLEI
jgi:hypothetical protein